MNTRLLWGAATVVAIIALDKWLGISDRILAMVKPAGTP